MTITLLWLFAVWSLCAGVALAVVFVGGGEPKSPRE